MRILHRIVSLWHTLFRKQRLDRDLDDELLSARWWRAGFRRIGATSISPMDALRTE